MVGYDINEKIVNHLLSGKSHILNVDDDMIKKYLNKSFYPTTDHKDLEKCDFIIICVPTPLTAEKEPDLRYTKNIDIDGIPIICDSKEYCPKIADKKNKNKILNPTSAIRNKIENKSLFDYHSTSGDYIALANKYKRKAKMEMKMQFIKNLYRYPVNLSIDITKKFVFV